MIFTNRLSVRETILNKTYWKLAIKVRCHYAHFEFNNTVIKFNVFYVGFVLEKT